MAKEIQENKTFSSRYYAYNNGQKFVFWIGILSFLSIGYWIVRLIIYSIIQGKPLEERRNAYVTQTYVFGWITIMSFVVVFSAIFILAYFGVLSPTPASAP